MRNTYAIIKPEAVEDIAAICNSGSHGAELCRAILSAMRPTDPESPHADVYATASITAEQMRPFFDLPPGSQLTTIKRAISDAFASGGLLRLEKGVKGRASVYTFTAYGHTSTRANVSESLGHTNTHGNVSEYEKIRTQKKIIRTQNDPYSDTFSRSNCALSINSSINNQLQQAAEALEGKEGEAYSIPTAREYAAYCKAKGYTIGAGEYASLEASGFTDREGRRIRHWRAWADAIHADDIPASPAERITAICPICGAKATAELQPDGTYKGVCTSYEHEKAGIQAYSFTVEGKTT